MSAPAQPGQVHLEMDSSGIATITIDNPTHRNALNNELIDRLIESFTSCTRTDSCRVVVLRGSGGIFCAGRELRDLVALQSQPIGIAEDTYQKLRQLNEAIYYCPKPTVAVIEGYAFGAGATVVSWCDIAIGEREAYMCYPEVHHGIPPSPAIMALLRGAGRKAVMEALLTGRHIPLEQALAIGLVNRICPKGSIDAELARLTRALLRAGPQAHRRTKEFIWQCEDAGLSSGMAAAVQSISVGLLSDEAREGVAAFLGRRAPSWMPEA